MQKVLDIGYSLMNSGGCMNQRILAIDASTPNVSIALLDGEKTINSTERPATKGESGNLPKDIDMLCKSSHINLADIGLFAVGIGPGNFTGLRISAAVAQAMALPDHTPVMGICSAEAIAYGLQAENETIIVVGDARRDRIWWLEFDPRIHTSDRPEPSVMNIRDASRQLADKACILMTPDWDRIGETLAAIVPPSVSLIRENRFPQASDIAKRARTRLSQGNGPETIEPIYVHPPVFVEPMFKQRLPVT